MFPKFKQSTELFKYLNLELEDTGMEDLTVAISKSLEFIAEAHRNNGRVLVHCAQGN